MTPRAVGRILRARIETANHVFEKWRTPSGIAYTKDGKISNEKAFKAARRYAKVRQEEATLRVDLSKPYRTQDDMAYRDKRGKWRAGEDAPSYIPGLKRGAYLDNETLSELRTIRSRERNFISFAAQFKARK